MEKFAFLFGIKGRVNRYQWLLGYIAAVVPFVVIAFLAEVLTDPIRKPLLAIAFVWLLAVGFFVGVKRMHDCNRSGFILLLSFVPFINLYLIILALSPGTPGPNDYGPEPVS
jgi:uncharacterized membrane protein YhaH (DUF805 family)